MKANDRIRNFAMIPMIGHDGEPNGVLQMYDFKGPITRLKMKKLIAMKKFLGACLDKVSLQQQNLETQVGFQNLLLGVEAAVRTKSEADKESMAHIELLMKSIDANNKWVALQYNRV